MNHQILNYKVERLTVGLNWTFGFSDEMDCGVEQIDGPARTLSPSCEQRDAGREGEGDADTTQRVDQRRPRIKLPQRSDMICGFASLKGQKISKFAFSSYSVGFIHEIGICINQP